MSLAMRWRDEGQDLEMVQLEVAHLRMATGVGLVYAQPESPDRSRLP